MLNGILNLIRQKRDYLMSDDFIRKLQPNDMQTVVVGSSLNSRNYNDLDILVVGLNEVDRNNLHHYVSSELEERGTHETLLTTPYGGNIVSMADPLDEKSIIHFLVDLGCDSFSKWHEQMVDRKEKYAILKL